MPNLHCGWSRQYESYSVECYSGTIAWSISWSTMAAVLSTSNFLHGLLCGSEVSRQSQLLWNILGVDVPGTWMEKNYNFADESFPFVSFAEEIWRVLDEFIVLKINRRLHIFRPLRYKCLISQSEQCAFISVISCVKSCHGSGKISDQQTLDLNKKKYTVAEPMCLAWCKHCLLEYLLWNLKKNTLKCC